MTAAPAQPSIYHITHVSNLPSIVSDSGIFSDAEMIIRGNPQIAVGMSTIKERRLRLPVKCHPGDHVGEYVPFYFCPRSIMLYILHMANHPELTYRGGQGSIVHLEADLEATAEGVSRSGGRSAFTLSNAGSAYAEFRDDLAVLDDIDWEAVANSNFSTPRVKEGKQAEFLVQRFMPWELIKRVGVRTANVKSQVEAALNEAAHQPPVHVLPRWYF